MSKFEFITALLSIAIAFALAEILAGIGRFIRERDRVSFFWVHVSWMVFLLIFMFQYWLSVWDYRADDFETVFDILVLLLPSLTFVLIAFLVTPSLPSEGTLDLQDYYLRNRAWIFGLGVLILFELTIERRLFAQQPLLHRENAFRVLGAGLLAWLAVSGDVRIHRAAVCACYGLFVVYALLLPGSG